jgi:hypothetical protein
LYHKPPSSILYFVIEQCNYFLKSVKLATQKKKKRRAKLAKWFSLEEETCHVVMEAAKQE